MVLAVSDAPPYPPHWDLDVVLSDGGTVHVRPLLPTDREAYLRFFHGLSAETRYYRFFSPKSVLTDEEVTYFTTVDHVDRVALAAFIGSEIVAVARYDRLAGDDGSPGPDAEVAFTIDDAHQGRGLGALMLEYLAAAGREHGLVRFVAETMPDNRSMLAVFHAAGYHSLNRFSGGMVEVEFPIAATADARAVVERREHRAEAASVRRILRPGSVVVVGDVTDPGSPGARVVENLHTGGFAGAVHLVDAAAPDGATVAGIGVRPIARRGRRRDRPGRPRRVGRRRSRRRRGVRREGGAGARRDVDRCPRPRCRGRGEPAQVGAGRPPGRDPPHRPRVLRSDRDGVGALGQHRCRRAADRSHRPDERVGRGRPGAVGVGCVAWSWRLVVRVGGGQGRREWQRHVAVLGGGPRHRRRARVPRELRQPPQVRPAGPAGVDDHADRRRSPRRGPCRRGAVPPGGCDPGRLPHRDVRRGRAPDGARSRWPARRRDRRGPRARSPGPRRVASGGARVRSSRGRRRRPSSRLRHRRGRSRLGRSGRGRADLRVGRRRGRRRAPRADPR